MSIDVQASNMTMDCSEVQAQVVVEEQGHAISTQQWLIVCWVCQLSFGDNNGDQSMFWT